MSASSSEIASRRYERKPLRYCEMTGQGEIAMANFVKAVKEANRILDEFGFTEPPINPVTIARDMGIKVYFAKLAAEHRNVSGFYNSARDVIYVNTDEYPRRMTFTIAHELGHRVLHREWAASNDYRVLMRDQSLESVDPKEQEANAFAANLLVPTHMLAKYRDVASTEELSRLFVVSMPVIRNRLKREFRS